MKSIKKRVLKSNIVINLLITVLYAYIRLVYLTTKWQTITPKEVDIAEFRKHPFIAVFWHGRFSIMPNIKQENLDTYVLSTPHLDGYLLSKLLQKFGLRNIYGSTKRQAYKAAIEMIDKLKSGSSVAITPDDGHFQKVRSNVVSIAKHSNSPIMPISFSTSHFIQLRSWDKLIIPLPFSRGTIIYGHPLIVKEKDDVVLLKNKLEEELIKITAEADKIYAKKISNSNI